MAKCQRDCTQNMRKTKRINKFRCLHKAFNKNGILLFGKFTLESSCVKLLSQLSSSKILHNNPSWWGPVKSHVRHTAPWILWFVFSFCSFIMRSVFIQVLFKFYFVFIGSSYKSMSSISEGPEKQMRSFCAANLSCK